MIKYDMIKYDIIKYEMIKYDMIKYVGLLTHNDHDLSLVSNQFDDYF